jgi:hypothetical protein
MLYHQTLVPLDNVEFECQLVTANAFANELATEVVSRHFGVHMMVHCEMLDAGRSSEQLYHELTAHATHTTPLMPA